MDNNVFEILNGINVNGHTEKKKDLTYLSWTWAVAEISKKYPDWSYEIEKFGDKKLPYVFDELTGYMVYTNVTIEGITREMWLPVMDGANKAMLAHEYEYDTKYGKKKVEKATMFDINKTIMRCLVKNLAMFGLGLYIYSGEDLPEDGNDNIPDNPKKKPTATTTKTTPDNTKNGVSMKTTSTTKTIKVDFDDDNPF